MQIIEQLPTPAEYNQLREAVGWGEYQESVIANSLPNTLCCLCVFVENQIIGMARVIGDGGLVYYIQDVVVLPEFQRQGIGTQLMDRIMAYIREHASNNTIIGLMSAVGKEAFYEKYGFTVRPTEEYGAGMTLFWQGEQVD